MSEFHGRVALVTGASGGVGSAISVSLGRRGARLILVGRDETRLKRTAVLACPSDQHRPELLLADLENDDDLKFLADALAQRVGRLDILVHAAGEYFRGKVAEMPIAQLDRLYRVNLRAPYLLTQMMLPLLSRQGGDVVFINSTQGLTAGPDVSGYAATKQGLKALSESVLAEAGDAGIRVLSVFLGRTATPLQERVFQSEGRPYIGSNLMPPEAVAEMVAAAVGLERRAAVTSMTMRATLKSY